MQQVFPWAQPIPEHKLYLDHFRIFCRAQITCMDHTVLPAIINFVCNYSIACLSFVTVHQMAPPLTQVGDIQLQLTTHLSTLKG